MSLLFLEIQSRDDNGLRLIVTFLDSQLANCYEILGVTVGVTEKELRDAYRKRIAQYHPDKVAGLGEELRQLAEEKSKEINLAYERVIATHRNSDAPGAGYQNDGADAKYARIVKPLARLPRPRPWGVAQRPHIGT